MVPNGPMSNGLISALALHFPLQAPMSSFSGATSNRTNCGDNDATIEETLRVRNSMCRLSWPLAQFLPSLGIGLDSYKCSLDGSWNTLDTIQFLLVLGSRLAEKTIPPAL